MNVEAYQDSDILCRTPREELITSQSLFKHLQGVKIRCSQEGLTSKN